MDITKLLAKVNEKLASQPDEEILHQCFDLQVGELALTCVKNADIKDEILGALGKAKDTASGFLQEHPSMVPVATGLGGAGLGALVGSQTGSKGEFETDSDYKHRRTNSILTGALAGGVIGTAAPSAAKALSNIADEPADNSVMGKIRAALGSAIQPTTAAAGAGAAGGVAHAQWLKGQAIKQETASGTGLNAAAARDSAIKNDASQDTLDALEARLAKATATRSAADALHNVSMEAMSPSYKALGRLGNKNLVHGVGGAALALLLQQGFANKPWGQN